MIYSNKKKVLIYRTDILPYSETFILEQIKWLKNWKGILVGDVKLKDGLKLDAIEAYSIFGESSLFFKIIRRISLYFPLLSLMAFYRIKKISPDLIHVHFATDCVKGWSLLKRFNVPVIVTLHGFDINIFKEWWEAGNSGSWMRKYPERLLEISKRPNVKFIAVSRAIKARAIEYGIPAEKISISYIGVDTDRFYPGTTKITERKQILFVGRLVEKKGCIYLIRAFEKIQNHFPDISLAIVGNGPLETTLKEYVVKNKVRAIFLGALNSDKIKQELDKSRVFCLPSITAENGDAEGLGIVVLEAQACGVPVITSARGGAKEGIIDGVTGYSHHEKAIDEIAKALEKILGDDEIAAYFGKSAREFVMDKMNIKECSEKLEEFYDFIFEKNKSNSSPGLR